MVPDPGRSLLHLRMRERLRDRARYCLAHLAPGVGDWVALPLPRGLRFLHYLTRPLRLAGRYGQPSKPRGAYCDVYRVEW